MLPHRTRLSLRKNLKMKNLVFSIIALVQILMSDLAISSDEIAHHKLFKEYLQVSPIYANSNFNQLIKDIRDTQSIRIKIFQLNKNIDDSPENISKRVINADEIFINYLSSYDKESLSDHLEKQLNDVQLKQLIDFYKSEKGNTFREASKLIREIHIDGFKELIEISAEMEPSRTQSLYAQSLYETQRERIANVTGLDRVPLSTSINHFESYAVTLRPYFRLHFSLPPHYRYSLGILDNTIISSKKFNTWIDFTHTSHFFSVRDLDKWEPLLYECHYIDSYFTEFNKENNMKILKTMGKYTYPQ